MLRTPAMLTLLAVAGCSTYVADVAPDRMRGMAVPDLIACAGIPDNRMQTKPDVLVLEWTNAKTAGSTKSTGWSVTLPLGAGVTWSPAPSSCHMQATVLRDGTVADIDMSSSNGMEGANSSCAQLVKQCVYDQSTTGLPKDYDAFKYFLPAAK